jgi:hypothetical protein
MELKAEQWLDYSGEPMPCYPKHEADAYIARQKYKRCMAMAKWCDSENYTACWYHENSERCKWTEKWHERWLKIAEKFKETK